jgi:Cu(I)/Ag(I) efflux system membrane protein CusA/SilA
MVRARGYLRDLDDLRTIPLRTTEAGVSVLLRDVADVQIGPEMRRGIAELDGEGEVAGGVVVLRSGKNALATIRAVQAKLAQLKGSLPEGVEMVTTYDRSQLIERAIANLRDKLAEEFVVVGLVCLLFLLHVRSALVVVVSLPLGVLASFVVMHQQGVNANIMSLGGIAIAIGAMVDAAIVMIENVHKHLEAAHHAHPGTPITPAERWSLVATASEEVGPALFFSLLVITFSFLPVFALEAQEGRLFAPLAFTKTYAMAASAGLAVTLVPVLMGYLIRGRIPSEQRNPLNRVLVRLYEPVLAAVLRFPVATLVVAALALAATWIPLSRLGGEFMPPLDEGDLLYMPSALPGMSAAKVSELLQQTDRMIRTVPEVASVFGKAGRADTATDPAPLEMFETTIRFRPRAEWRPGMTPDKLVEELDRVVRCRGSRTSGCRRSATASTCWRRASRAPSASRSRGRISRRSTELAAQIADVAKAVPGVTSALAERLTGGRYIDVDIDRRAAARYGMNIDDVQSFVTSAIGGENVGEMVLGRSRFPINVRYPRELRDSVEQLRALPLLTPMGARIRLGDIARLVGQDGPPMLRSENARLSGWVYVDLRGRDLRSAVHEMQAAVERAVKLPPGYSISWAGQFEYLERATARLKLVTPVTLGIIFLLLYLTLRSAGEALLLMATVPFALVGGIWFVWTLGHAFSVATAVGFLALAGVAAEFGVVMLIYLKSAWTRHRDAGGRRRPRCRTRRRDPRRRRAARASEGDDGRGDPRRPAADHVGRRRRVGGHAAHRRADAGRHGVRAAAVDARDSRGVSADASSRAPERRVPTRE